MSMLPFGYRDTDISLAIHTGFTFEGAAEVDRGLKFLGNGVTHFISFIIAKDTRNYRMAWLDQFKIDKRAIMDDDYLLVLGIEVPPNELGKVGTREWKPKWTIVAYRDYVAREETLREPVDFFRALVRPSRPASVESPDFKGADI